MKVLSKDILSFASLKLYVFTGWRNMSIIASHVNFARKEFKVMFCDFVIFSVRLHLIKF